MKRFVAIAGMCILLIGLGVGVTACNANTSNSASVVPVASVNSTPTSSDIKALTNASAAPVAITPVSGTVMTEMTEMNDIPVYPGASDLGHGCDEEVPARCGYHFNTANTEEQ